MVGKGISHYRILEQLGAGGMGVVYRAHDERLDRDVALKVLPAGTLADETARNRFRREALTLSQLNHPNIAVVHDFDTEDGVDFLAMEYVAGETLAAKLAAGPLPEKEVIALATQITEALEEAHEHDVIHRDLKPGNVMVTAKGRVKVLDFGLAKLVKPTEVDAATASLAETQAGAVMGTVPYMAPEQLQGKVVDARADIYALGAVLYEMATGQRPFPEKQSTQLIAAILTEAPQPPRALNGRVSAGLEAIILKALEKKPEQRYASAQAMLEDLGRLSVGASVQTLSGTASVGPREGKALPYRTIGAAGVVALIGLAVLVGLNVGGLRDRLLTAVGARRAVPLQKIESLAVLPLENLTGDAGQEYFADGMTEELITNLAKISALKVISRTSVMHYKGTKMTIPEIAKELHVDAVVEGSVQRSGERVRISAQLVEATTDTHLWAETYERDLSDVMALQDEVTGSIAREIKVALTPEERTRLASARPVNPEAHEAYLKGQYYLYQPGEEGIKQSRQFFEQAIAIDPNYALGYSGLSDYYGFMFASYLMPTGEGCAKAEPAAVKAIELDDNLAEAHKSLGAIKFYCHWDWAGSESEIRRSLQLNPGVALVMLANITTREGRFQEAVAAMKKAIQEDPMSTALIEKLGWVYYMSRQYDLAVEQYQKVLELDPHYPDVHLSLGDVYVQKGMLKEAVSEYQKYARLSPDELLPIVNLAYAYAISGKRSEALKILDQSGRDSRHPSIPAVARAYVLIALGDKQPALDWLEKAYAQRERAMLSLKVDPAFDPIRSDPRFQDLLRRMNFPK